MKIGDTIKCRDKDDMVDTMLDLAKVGIETDFLYETDGVKLVVTKVTPKEPRADVSDTNVGKWIPVSERLPDDEQDVLVCSDTGNIEVTCGSCSYTLKGEFIWYTSGWMFGKVIAWMPLPKPYIEADKEEDDGN